MHRAPPPPPGSKIHGLWDGDEKIKQEMYIGDNINIYIYIIINNNNDNI